MIASNDEWICVVPFWAMWPYETMLIPLKHTLRFNDLTESQRQGQYINIKSSRIFIPVALYM